MILHAALSGLGEMFRASTLLFMLIGAVVGLFFGATPGLGGNMFLAVMLPLVYHLKPPEAFALLLGGHSAITFGGAVSAILFNTPGTGDCVATCWDGYAMSQKGLAGRAIAAASAASALGGLFGSLVLLLVIPLIASIITAFGPPEYFVLALLGLFLVALVGEGSLVKGLVAGGMGLLLSFIGNDPVTGQIRFTFGSLFLIDGVHFVNAIIGLYAISALIDLVVSGRRSVASTSGPAVTGSWAEIRAGVGDVLRRWTVLLRCSALGSILGPLPGIGGSITNILSYGYARQSSSYPERFGTGIIDGVIAPQSADNSKEAGALIPTVAFGIPGSSAMAIFLGAFYILGLQPGPSMLSTHLDLTFLLVYIVVVGNLFACGLGLVSARLADRVTRVPSRILVPVIVVLAFAGSYTIAASLDNIVAMLAFGVLGYFMRRFRYSRPALIIGLLLGNIAETNFLISYKLFHLGFLLQPLVLAMFALGVLAGGAPVVLRRLAGQGRGMGVNGA